MKTKLAEIISGPGILITMLISVILDPTGFYIRVLVGEPLRMKTLPNPDNKEVIATLLAYLVVLLGIAITSIALIRLAAKIRAGYVTPYAKTILISRRLVIWQMGLALTAAVAAFWVIIWGFPTSYHYMNPHGFIQRYMIYTGNRFTWAQGLSILSFIFSITALGSCVAQIRKLRLVKANCFHARSIPPR
jgi:hypothetical protein